MKTKYFLVGFLLLSMFAFGTMARAQDYTVKAPIDKLMIMELKTFDEEAADTAWGEDDIEEILGEDAELGALMGGMITGIEEDDELMSMDDGDDVEGWLIEGWIYIGDVTTDKADLDDPDDDDMVEYEDMPLFADPADWGELDEMTELIVMGLLMIVPAPVAGYLDGIDWKDVEVVGSGLEWEYESIEEEDVIVYQTYNAQGVMNSQGEKLADGTVIYEFKMGGAIPGYELPIFLGVTAIAAIGIIYTIMKKK